MILHQLVARGMIVAQYQNFSNAKQKTQEIKQNRSGAEKKRRIKQI